MVWDFVRGGLFALAALLAAIAALLWYSLALPGRPHKGALPQATAEEISLAGRLQRHIVAIASEPHNTGHCQALEKAAQYIEQALAAEGYQVVPQAYEARECMVRNLEATIEPAEAGPETKTVVIGAHYDSFGDAPGANDNGSGTAAVLELARLLKDLRPAHTRLRLVLFVNEEPPFFQTPDMGSYRYAELLAERGEAVAAMICLETIGYFSDAPGSQQYPPPFGAVFPSRGDFVAFVGMPGSRPLVQQVAASFRAHTAFPTIGGIAPGFIPGIDWSDHWAFARQGFQAMMITDTAIFRYPHYHRPTDTPEKVDYERLARITKGVERVLRDMVQ